MISQAKAKTMIFLPHHIHEDLKSEYLSVKDPYTMYNKLKERYAHLKLVIFLKFVMIVYIWDYTILNQKVITILNYSGLVQNCCYVERKLLIWICWKRYFLLFISRIGSCNIIERKVLQNILNSFHVFLLSDKITSCWWKITNHDQLEQHHSLKQMLWILIVDEVVVVVMVEEETMEEEEKIIISMMVVLII